VTKFHSIFKVEDRQAIVMEVAKEGSLKSYLKRGNTIQEQDLKRSFKALVEGIKSFHLAGITLRDIKLDNILVFRDKKNLVQLKFADLGACTYDDELVDTVVGTPLYLPKEAFYQRKGFPFSQRKVNPVELEKVDIHALGVVLYLTLVPKAKFTRKQVKDKAAMLEWYLSDFDFECKEFQQLKKTNPIVADLLLHMLAPKVEERSTADQVLAHKWFLE
jgi:serine/threonine protein kinase